VPTARDRRRRSCNDELRKWRREKNEEEKNEEKNEGKIFQEFPAPLLPSCASHAKIQLWHTQPWTLEAIAQEAIAQQKHTQNGPCGVGWVWMGNGTWPNMQMGHPRKCAMQIANVPALFPTLPFLASILRCLDAQPNCEKKKSSCIQFLFQKYFLIFLKYF
jgi:hypothetical protein